MIFRLRSIKFALQTLWRLVKNPWHFDRVSDDEYAVRLGQCSVCPKYVIVSQQCGICTCYMPLKAMLRTEKCPDNPPRWL